MGETEQAVGLREVEAAIRGDKAAEETVAWRAYTLALRTATGLFRSREQANDIAQDVTLDVLRQLKKLRDPRAFEGWVHTITVRKSKRALGLRSLRWRSETAEDDVASGVPDPASGEDLAERLALEGATARALEQLPVRQRLAVVLRYVHDLTEAEIADALGCAPGTAASLLSRARTQLSEDPELQAFARPEEGDTE